MLHCVRERHGAGGQNCDCVDSQIVDDLILLAQAASKRQDGQAISFCHARHGPDRLAVGGLRIDLPLCRNDQIGGAYLLLKMNGFQHDLGAGTQERVEKGDQARAQAASSSRAGDIGDGGVEVALNNVAPF